MKKNFYLKHSLMATQDPRMKVLIEEEGLKGLGAYWFILEKLELLPQPCAQLEYLKPFCSKQAPLLYLGKIICKYQLFIIDEEGYFMPDELNPSRMDRIKSGKSEQEIAENDAKNAENDAKNAQNAAKFEENMRFFMRKTAKKAKENDVKVEVKEQKNSDLPNNTTANTKENIKDIIITAEKEKERTDDDDNSVSEKPAPPQTPKRQPKVSLPVNYRPKRPPLAWHRRRKTPSVRAITRLCTAIHAP